MTAITITRTAEIVSVMPKKVTKMAENVYNNGRVNDKLMAADATNMTSSVTKFV